MTRKTDIDRVRQQGRRIRTANFEVRTLASPFSYPRVGIIVPRYKHTIVERNRLRRRIRELARVHLLPSLAPQDVLVRANPAAYSRSFDALTADVLALSQKLGKSAE